MCLRRVPGKYSVCFSSIETRLITHHSRMSSVLLHEGGGPASLYGPVLRGRVRRWNSWNSRPPSVQRQSEVRMMRCKTREEVCVIKGWAFLGRERVIFLLTLCRQKDSPVIAIAASSCTLLVIREYISPEPEKLLAEFFWRLHKPSNLIQAFSMKPKSGAIVLDQPLTDSICELI